MAELLPTLDFFLILTKREKQIFPYNHQQGLTDNVCCATFEKHIQLLIYVRKSHEFVRFLQHSHKSFEW